MKYFLLLLLLFSATIYCGCGSDETSEPEPEPRSEFEPPPDLQRLGVCQPGMVVKPGEGCTYIANGEKITFWVNPEGLGCRSGPLPGADITILGKTVETTFNICTNSIIERDDAFSTTFSAKQNDDNSWGILDVP